MGSVDPGRGPVGSTSQQQVDQESPAQQERAAWRELFAEQADASPATDSIPRIAARTMKGSRR